ncbi:MAG: threonine synthase [Spirochaetes bacterium]|nr:threonine synthase [Spirochaetota bacterium]
MRYPGVIESYKEYLPVTDKTPIISLNEGNTPLIELRTIPRKLGIDLKIYIKHEGLNPTASFKDRGMTVAISKAVEEGSKAVMCASTGNTSASAAAYAARAGLKAIVIIPKNAIALGKLVQALIHNAMVFALKGNFDDALEIVQKITSEYPVTLVNSINPYRLEGQKTAAFEICDSLGSAPDYHCIPVGNAGNITSYWMGYTQYYEKKKINKKPRMMGFQAKGAAPIVHDRVIKDPQTVATAIKIGNPARWKDAVKALKESGGYINIVSDEEILNTYTLLAREEGIFVEPASATSLAGLIKYYPEGIFEKGKTVVCTCTGHGLKDPDMAIKSSKTPIVVKKIDEILKIIDF